MALPAALLKAKQGLKNVAKRAGQAKMIDDATGGQASNMAKKASLAGCGCFAVALFFLLIIIIVPFTYIFGIIQLSDGATSKRVGTGNLIYGTEALEEYYLQSSTAYESPNIPSVDLANSTYGGLESFKSVENFNEHIKSSVKSAGYGTRAAVVTAGIALIGDYIVATGKRLRYDQENRQWSETEGIVNSNYYGDCSSFAWWALYNGGFNIPCYPYTVTQMDWAYANGYNAPIADGQAGDFLVSYGHIILIIGTYDGGYYCAEQAGWGTGGIISKRDISGLGNYILIDMEDYYNNPSNIRSV